jgi:phage baseplate assembly protein W
VGWKFPLRIGPAGGFLYSRYEEDVEEAIWIILGTARGERPMDPRFGCGIHDSVFASISNATLGDLAFQVRSALTEWEPRIDVIDVRVEEAPGRESLLLIRVDYRIRANNAFRNLVYPFYITEGSGA